MHKIKKTDPLNFLIYGFLAVMLLYFAAVVGTSFEKASIDENGEKLETPDFGRISEILEKTVTDTEYIAGTITNAETWTFKITAIGCVGGLLFLMLKMSEKKKRFHRKGEEHGSAKWATAKETLKLKDNEKPKNKGYKEKNYTIPVKDENGNQLLNGKIKSHCKLKSTIISC
ncbi:hypothetical protein FACS189499_07390 [Clostridia bacterium]|nr:hypothetical protein FACS189499_07390 [Clostridia bacterium]